MSEGEVAVLRRAIEELSKKSDSQHAENQKSQEKDRETFRNALSTQQQSFTIAMNEQRTLFQEALNKQFIEHYTLDKKVERVSTMLEGVVGSGQPGEGRIGALEASMELMKKFRWQALTVIMTAMWAVELWRHGR